MSLPESRANMHGSLGPDARSLIDSAKDGDEPTLDDADRVRARLARRLAVAAAAGTTATVGAKSASAIGTLSFGAKLLVAVAVASGVAAGVAVIRAPSSPPLASPLVARAPAPTASARPIVSVSAPPSAAPEEPEVAPPVVVPSARPRIAPPLPPPPAPTALALPPTTPPRPAPMHAPPAADAPPHEPVAASAHEANATTPAPPPPITADSVREEAAILRAAERALAAHDGATALTRLDEHAARFPQGALGEERAAAHVLAMCSVGRVTEAREEAARFLVARPRSPLAAQVRASCAKE